MGMVQGKLWRIICSAYDPKETIKKIQERKQSLKAQYPKQQLNFYE